MTAYREAFEYAFSPLSPDAPHVDPPAVAVYQTLLVRGPDGGAAPAMAIEWTISDDGLTWLLRLRDDLAFHSGSPATSREVLATLQRLREHCLPGDRQLWYWDPVRDIDAPDQRTIRLRLHYPHPRLFTLLWGTHTAIHDEAMRSALGDDFGRVMANGTGPYRMASWTANRIRLERATASSHLPEGLVFSHLPSASDRLDALLADEVDCAHALDAVGLAALHDDSRFSVCRQRQPSNMYLSLDWARDDLGFDDVRTRQAMSLAIDRDRLVEVALGGLGAVAYGPLPPGLPFHDPAVDRGRHDPGQARALLAGLGWQPGPDAVLERGGIRLAFECVVQDDPVFARVFDLVAQDLAQAGIRITPLPARPFADFYAAVGQHPAAAISKWLWPDPVEALIGFTSTSTAPFPNWQRASSPDLDAAFDAFLRATTAAGHQAAASTIQRIFIRDLPYVPLLTPDDTWAWNRRVTGFRPRPGDLYPAYDGVGVGPR